MNIFICLLSLIYWWVWDWLIKLIWPVLNIKKRNKLVQLINASKEIEEFVTRIDCKCSGHFVQVGSNDGISNDPLRHVLKGGNRPAILLEPVPFIFEVLEQTYIHHESVITLNLAIQRQSDRLSKFYYVDQSIEENFGPGYKDYYLQLSSFNYATIISHHARLAEFLVSTEVPATTLQDLLEKYEVEKVALLHVDAEGYDADVLKTIDLESRKPSALIFEHKHLAFIEKIRTVVRLWRYGYRFMVYHDDILCEVKQLKLRD